MNCSQQTTNASTLDYAFIFALGTAKVSRGAKISDPGVMARRYHRALWCLIGEALTTAVSESGEEK